MRQIIGNFERDRHELYATELADCKARRPTPGLAGKDGLRRLPLPLVRFFVDEKPQLGFGASPEIAFEPAKCQQIKAIELNVAKAALFDMPHEHALAAIVGRWLRIHRGRGCCSCRYRTSHRRAAILVRRSCVTPKRSVLSKMGSLAARQEIS